MTYNKTISLSVESSDLPLCDESTACEILLVTTHTCSTSQWIHMQRVVFYADNRVYVSISHRVLHRPVTQAYIHVHVCNSTEWSRAHSDTRLVILQWRNTTPTSSHRFSLMKWNFRKVCTIAWKLLIRESHVRRLCTNIQQIWSPACVKRPVYVIQRLGDWGELGGWGVSFLTCIRDSRWLLRAFSVFHSGLPLPIMNNLQEHRCDAALAGYRSPSHKRVE